ncbi:phosphohydrolase [Dyadobacter sp. LJ53]|uniref:Phosphohydrolase n=2 Tax=Dyadobacter chenwenxiniae TaxID=2906456 RepID=A0A9X1PP41_9BACT|nr:phosphohydrolase [Dyadobacter chenwenxiniae]MCF0049755.1 phosphohydrolase [Dyadobacter chenwenxiniae]MCF0062181.1 phosphohydrolase [Dyadobacter chenwenxiniae]
MNASPTTPSITEEAQKQPMKQKCEHHAECMKVIQAILDDEATDAEKDHFRENMDKCLPCIESYRLEKCIKDSLNFKIEKKPCPESILKTIISKINS